MGKDWERLADAVARARVLAGHSSRAALAAHIGTQTGRSISHRTISELERGQPVSKASLVLIEVGLGWPNGHAEKLLDGTANPADGARLLDRVGAIGGDALAYLSTEAIANVDAPGEASSAAADASASPAARDRLDEMLARLDDLVADGSVSATIRRQVRAAAAALVEYQVLLAVLPDDHLGQFRQWMAYAAQAADRGTSSAASDPTTPGRGNDERGTGREGGPPPAEGRRS